MSGTPQTLNVVLSISAAGLLRRALTLAGRRERVVGFTDCLACGPINPPAPAARVRWMVDELGFRREDWNWLPRSANAFWKHALEPGLRRVVWTSSRSANEHSAFLACVDRFGDLPYEVIDLADAEVDHQTTDGRHWRVRALSLGMLGSEAIAAQSLWDRAKPFYGAEHQANIDAWRGLQCDDAPLRIIGPTGLVSAPLSYFDERLMAQATDQWGWVVRMIGHVLADEDDYFQVGDHVLAARVVWLIGVGKLECRMPPESPPDGYEFGFGLSSLPRLAEVRLARR